MPGPFLPNSTSASRWATTPMGCLLQLAHPSCVGARHAVYFHKDVPELPPSPPHPGPRGRISWAPETVAAARPAASGLQPQGVALLFSQPGFLSRHLGRSTGFSSLSLPASSRQSHTVQCPVAASPSPGRHPRRSGWIRDLRLGNCRMKGPGWGRGEVKMLTPLESAQL